MAQQTINVGAAPNDGTGTPLRTAFQYTNSNFTELYTALGGGSGLPGASGQLIFNNGTSLAGDNELFYNATTNTLTTEKLIVPGNTQVAGSLSNLYVGSILNPTLFANTNTKLVGIGTATPADSLHIYGAGNALIEGTAGIYAKAITKVGAKSWQFGYRSGTLQYELQEDGVERYTIGNGGTPHTWYIGASTAMTLNSTGLGVGTSPSYKLHVFGASPALTIQDSSSAAGGVGGTINFIAYTSGTSGANIEAQIKGVKSSASSAGELLFFTSDSSGNSQQRFMVDGTGNVGIGVTPSAWNSAFGSVLQFKSAGSSAGGSLTGSSADNFRMFSNTYYDGAYKYIAAGFATQYEQSAGSHVWYLSGTTAGAINGAITFSTALSLDKTGSLVLGSAAVATTATDGFLYIPGCAGTPTGTPTAKTGRVPLVVDTTNNKLYFYSGGAWVAAN